MKAQALLNVGQKADHGDGLDASESAADANFADLGIENIRVVLPKESRGRRWSGRSDGGQAGAKVGGNSVKILHEAIPQGEATHSERNTGAESGLRRSAKS